METKSTRSFTIINPRANGKGKRIHHRMPGATRFCAIDGEGINVAGEHRYALLGMANESLIDENGLSWQEIFRFIYSHYARGTAFVGFFLGYDFNQCLKTLPEERATMLLTEEGRAKRMRRGKNPSPWPVECDGWEFDILASKRLKIRPKQCDCPRVRGKSMCKCKRAPWMYICDGGPFFQQSFLAVIDPKGWNEPIVTSEEFALIEEGKKNRADVTSITPEVIEYNRLENEILERVMTTLDDGFRQIGVMLPPSKWFGPGQAAQAWLSLQQLPKSTDLLPTLPQAFLEAARASYFGGWFEIMMHGLVKGITHEYDINSAYSYIIAHLPCLEHGEWSEGYGMPTVAKSELCLVQARVWSYSPFSDGPPNRKIHIGAMLHRDEDGGISRPTVTEGWFWWHELDAARRAKCIQPIAKVPRDNLHPQYFKWVKYKPCDCPPPLRGLKELYLKRLEVGKNTPLGKGAKTVYNAAYGKFAQSIGHPVYGNPIYASLITAGCRTMILDAIATHPKGKADVCMVATDGVYFLSEHPSLPIGSGLGEWEHSEKRNLCLFKPGVYWDDNARREADAGHLPHFKARGVSAADFGPQIREIDRQFNSWKGNPPPIGNLFGPAAGWPSVEFATSFAMVSCLQAIRQNDWSRAGWVSDCERRKQSSNPYDKRCGVYYDGNYYRSEPITPGLSHRKDASGLWRAYWDCASKPYEKRFGMEDPFSDEYKQSMGISPDGNVSELIGFAIKGMNNGNRQ